MKYLAIMATVTHNTKKTPTPDQRDRKIILMNSDIF
jgi:hypothetical protein